MWNWKSFAGELSFISGYIDQMMNLGARHLDSKFTISIFPKSKCLSSRRSTPQPLLHRKRDSSTRFAASMNAMGRVRIFKRASIHFDVPSCCFYEDALSNPFMHPPCDDQTSAQSYELSWNDNPKSLAFGHDVLFVSWGSEVLLPYLDRHLWAVTYFWPSCSRSSQPAIDCTYPTLHLCV